MSVFLYIAAAIVFALGVFGVTPGNMTPLEVTDLGLLLLAVGFLIGPAVAYIQTRHP